MKEIIINVFGIILGVFITLFLGLLLYGSYLEITSINEPCNINTQITSSYSSECFKNGIKIDCSNINISKEKGQ